ncbi:hypothetical protein GCM10022198_15570 [Klugiella xanthotipulae]
MLLLVGSPGIPLPQLGGIPGLTQGSGEACAFLPGQLGDDGTEQVETRLGFSWGRDECVLRMGGGNWGAAWQYPAK